MRVLIIGGTGGLGDYFTEVTEGRGRLLNGFEWKMKPGFRSYLDTRLSDSEFTEIIENLMVKPPSR